MRSCALTAVAVVMGCAASPPSVDSLTDNEYRRAASRVEAAEHLRRLETACARAGGVVRVARRSSGRFRATADEMRSATCVRRGAGGVAF